MQTLQEAPFQLDALAAQWTGSTLLREPSVHAITVKSVPAMKHPQLISSGSTFSLWDLGTHGFRNQYCYSKVCYIA